MEKTKKLDGNLVVKIGSSPNLVLPKGWIAVNHQSGGIVYLHKESRVATWSWPYNIGENSIRKHNVPSIAIPCLHQLSSHPQHQSRRKDMKRKSPCTNEEIVFPKKYFKSAVSCQPFCGTSSNKRTSRIATESTDTIHLEEANSHVTTLSQEPSLLPQIPNCASGSILQASSSQDSQSENLCIENDVSFSSEKSYSLTEYSESEVVVDDIHIKNGFCAESRDEVVSKSNPMGQNNTDKPCQKLCFEENATFDDKRIDSISEHFTEKDQASSRDNKEPYRLSQSNKTLDSDQRQLDESRKLDRNLLENEDSNSGYLEMVDYEKLHDYLDRIFEFRQLSTETASLPIFHDGTVSEKPKNEISEKLKAIPSLSKFDDSSKSKSSISAAGKTSLTILNEYCQKILKKRIKFVDAASVGNEFAVEAEIGGVKYGRGKGLSKKIARQNAASQTLQILLPEQYNEMARFSFTTKELQVIDELDINDVTVAECAKVLGLPLPFEILQDCLKRNSSLSASDLQFSLTRGEKNSPHTYEMKCGTYYATGSCINKKAGRHLASQSILKQIHPELSKWGQIVNIYCDRPGNLIKEAKKLTEDKEISRMLSSDVDVLKKLKSEMRKLNASI